MTKILLVEDEEALYDPLSFLLGREGFTPVVVDNGLDAVPAFEREDPDLVLLDVMLPGMSGMEVCKKIRASSSVPIIMLTAKDSEIDKVLGLELGADDYVTKPYSSRELMARIRAVLRRQSSDHGDEQDQKALAAGPVRMDVERHVVTVGPVRMDVERHVVTVDGEEVSMPLKEFELLEILLRNTGRVMTRAQLIERVWGADYVGDTKTLDVHIKRLRSKIEPKASSPRYVITVRGLGYKFEA